MNSTMRVVLGVGVVVVAVVLLVVLKDGGDDNSSDSDRRRSAAASRRSRDPDDRRQERRTGRRHRRTSTSTRANRSASRCDSDVADEVHMHGYDIEKDVKAGGSVTFDFPATIEGIFEAELEGRKEQIARTEVNP